MEPSLLLQSADDGASSSTYDSLPINSDSQAIRNTVYIVRHSERMDEVDKIAWKKYVDSKAASSGRKLKYIAEDAVITVNGKRIASRAGRLLAEMIASSTHGAVEAAIATDKVMSPEGGSSGISAIFSSRLVRCVQTAYELAKQFNVPIVVCKGLALTAIAVQASMGKFEFASLEELRSLCPGVTVLSCDEDDTRESIPQSTTTLSSASKTAARSVSASDAKKKVDAAKRESKPERAHAAVVDGPYPQIPHNPKDWLSPILLIAKRYPASIIVCHRETIRNVIETRLKLPYCAIATGQYQETLDRIEGCPSNQHGGIIVSSVLDVDGSIVWS